MSILPYLRELARNARPIGSADVTRDDIAANHAQALVSAIDKAMPAMSAMFLAIIAETAAADGLEPLLLCEAAAEFLNSCAAMTDAQWQSMVNEILRKPPA